MMVLMDYLIFGLERFSELATTAFRSRHDLRTHCRPLVGITLHTKTVKDKFLMNSTGTVTDVPSVSGLSS